MNDTASIDELWAQYEQINIENFMGSHQSGLLVRMISIVEKTDVEKANQLRWELAAIDFMNAIKWRLSSLDNIQHSNLKNIKDNFLTRITPDKTLPYFKDRINSTQNPYHKARLSYCIWEVEKKVAFLQVTIQSLQEIAELSLKNGKLHECIQAIQVAYLLSMMNNLQENIKHIATITIEYINRIYDNRQYRWILELMRIIAHCGKKQNVDSDIIKSLLTKTTDAVEYYKTNKNYHLERMFYEVRIPLINVLVNDENKEQMKREAIESVAKSYERQGDEDFLKEDGGLLSSEWYKRAAEQYQLAGNPKQKEMLSKSGEATKKIKWKEVKVEVNLQELKFMGQTPTEIYREICQFQGLIPPVDYGRDLESSIADYIHTIVYNNRYPVSDSSKEDTKELRIKRAKIQYIVIGEVMFSSAFERLEEENRVSADSLINFLRDAALFDEDSMILVEHGIREHFDRDYISSAHILVPQIEVALRSLLTLNGIPIEKKEKAAIQVKELGGILLEDSTKRILGEELTDYLLLRFADPEGMNIRNEIAHGLLKAGRFNFTLSSSIIYALLKLGCIAVKMI